MEKYYELVNRCNKIAINAIRYMYTSLNLDTYIVDIMEESSISFKSNDDIGGNFASHNEEDNSIGLNVDTINKTLVAFNETLDNCPILKDTLIIALIHEHIHSIRDLILKNPDNINLNDTEYNKLSSKYSNLIEINSNVSKKVLSINKTEYDNIIMVYNYDNNSFEEHLIYDDILELSISEIERKLNNNEIDNIIIYKVYMPPKDAEILNVTKIHNCRYIGVEEALVEALAAIIYDVRLVLFNISIEDKIKMCIKSEMEYLSESDIIIGLLILSKMSIEDIKLYLTTYMHEEYIDLYLNALKDNYDEILELSRDAYVLELNRNTSFKGNDEVIDNICEAYYSKIKQLLK